jgi:hypothetical protein
MPHMNPMDTFARLLGTRTHGTTSALVLICPASSHVILPPSRTPKKQAKAGNLLALGTAQGHVIIWDCARGEVAATPLPSLLMNLLFTNDASATNVVLQRP